MDQREIGRYRHGLAVMQAFNATSAPVTFNYRQCLNTPQVRNAGARKVAIQLAALHR